MRPATRPRRPGATGPDPRILLAIGLGTLVLLPAAAAQQRPALLGEHGDWTAATYVDGGKKICYAFTRAARSTPAGRHDVMMTVTHRDAQRDQVVMTSGYAYPNGAEVKVTVGSTELPFYTAGNRAAPRDRAATIRAFRGGREAEATGPGPGGRGTATDSFSLSGFSAAYEAIGKECPAPGGARR